MRPSARFWDRIAVRYSKQPIEDPASYEKKLRITQSHLRPEMELVELGCGTGSTAILHSPHVKRIRAYDISARMLSIAKEKAAAAGVNNVFFERAPIHEIQLSAASVDMVLMLSVLHLLPNKEQALSQAFEWLKPGGVLVTSTVCMREISSVFKYVVQAGSYVGLFPHTDWFTADELQEAITNAGFELDYRWRPGADKAVFIVAKKPS